jgi:hypothetical protein
MEIRTTDDIVTIAVAADQWVSNLQISLWRLGSITGRVIDERGEPVVGVAVRGFCTAWVAGHLQFVGTNVVSTDDRGEYRLANLMPGKYAVSVLSVQSTVLDSTPEGEQRRAVGELARGGSNPGLPAVDVDGTHRLAISNFATPPPPSSTAPRAYAAQFYPHTSSMSNAELVEIPYGGSRRGVDFQLQPVPAVKVSGRVEGADASAMLLRLLPAGSEQLGAGSEAATTIVERDGSFTFLNVPSGNTRCWPRPSSESSRAATARSCFPTRREFPLSWDRVGAGTTLPGLAYARSYQQDEVVGPRECGRRCKQCHGSCRGVAPGHHRPWPRGHLGRRPGAIVGRDRRTARQRRSITRDRFGLCPRRR